MREDRSASLLRKKDEIRIRELEVYARHGVFPEETKLGQKFYVNATLFTNTRAAGETDDLCLSVDYGRVCQEIHRFLTDHTYRLLEAAAECLACHLLLTFAGIDALELEIRKPAAPIPLPVGSVSVCITRGWKRAVISCGSNLGDKEAYLRDAIDKITCDMKCRVLRSADFIVTAPYGGVQQDDFVNGAFVLETLYEPEELLTLLNRLEAEAGRERKIHWGPRTLDLDIIFYEDCVMRTDRLTIPHPDMQNREFVLQPLMQIAPEWVHPVYGRTVAEIWEKMRGNP